MGILAKLAVLFRNEPRQDTDQKWREGSEAFLQGQRLHFARLPHEALPFLDKAISSGFEGADVYAYRGLCLQSLRFDFEAIDDFDKAIALEPGDSNLYFIRAHSKGASGDLKGQFADFLGAIQVSKIDNAANRSHNSHALESGHKGIEQIYEMALVSANLDLEQQAFDEIRLRGPGASLGPDLASSRRSKTQRRA